MMVVMEERVWERIWEEAILGDLVGKTMFGAG